VKNLCVYFSSSLLDNLWFRIFALPLGSVQLKRNFSRPLFAGWLLCRRRHSSCFAPLLLTCRVAFLLQISTAFHAEIFSEG
jgi:hypothetical protein